MIPVLSANSYQRRMDSGRTRPCLFFCGDSNEEYVVKLKAGVDGRETGLSFELIAAQLAILLGVPTPEPAIIEIDPVVADMMEDGELAAKIRESAGFNFGSKFMTGGYGTWPVGMEIPVKLMQTASEIFAFDALIQNPDRKADKPNILWKGDELYIIDHEVGFSFAYDIFPSASSRQIAKLDFLKKHLFFQGLKQKTLNFDRFAGAVASLSGEMLESIFSNVPKEWDNDKIPKVYNHVKEIVDHADEFIGEVRRFLL